MKILYLTDQTYLHGGIEKVLSQKANYFADIFGDEVTIVTYNQMDNNPCYVFSDKIKFIDLGVNYEVGKSYFHPRHLQKIPYHLSSLNKILLKIQPDIVISSSFGPDFYFLPYLQRQIPKIKEFHTTRYFSSQVTNFKANIFQRITHHIEKSFTKLVILNEDELPYYHSDNMTVIPNPAEIDCTICTLHQKRIISAGRISYQKNFEDLIEIGKQVLQCFPDWQIHIYGDDYLGRQEILQQNINNLNLQNNIFFKGTTSDLKNTFLDYSIYVMTSNHETFPMVLLEALSVGLPVISYDCPTGPSRILADNEDSFLVPYKNLDIFVQKLKELMQDENLRIQMGGKGRENVQRFSIEKIMKQWNGLLNSLIIKKTNP